jgi:hypothetical protein
VWVKGVKAARDHASTSSGSSDVLEGFTFHLLRSTTCSLMVSAGMDPAVAAERAGHTDGGALFLRTYRHLYEAEKRSQALRLEAKIASDLAAIGQRASPEAQNRLNEAGNGDGRYWARTRLPHSGHRWTGVVNADANHSSTGVAAGQHLTGVDTLDI